MLFQFIFRFVVPVFVATRKMRKGFKAMQEQMKNAQKDNYQGFNNSSNSQTSSASTSQRPASAPKRENNPAGKEDYLDFEEVKD